MKQSRPLYFILSGAVLFLMLAALYNPANVFAQDNAPAAETPTEQPTEPPTATATTEPTATGTTEPTPTGTTEAPATATGEPTATETTEPTPTVVPPAPVVIPEPITVVLFGTGLAALSAAAASRRKNDDKGDSE